MWLGQIVAGLFWQEGEHFFRLNGSFEKDIMGMRGCLCPLQDKYDPHPKAERVEVICWQLAVCRSKGTEIEM